MQWLGDYQAGQTLDFAFDTTVGGLPSTLSAATIAVYKGSNLTQSVAGVTVTNDYDGLTGLNHVTIDLASDVFYAVANDYQVVMTTGTLGGNTIRRVLAHFSIENRCVNWAKVASPTTTVGLSGTTIGVVTALANGAIVAATFAAGALDAVWSTAVRLLTAGTNIVLAKGVGVTGFTDLSAAQVNAEVVDALAVDTYAEPGQATPPATTTLAAKLNYLYKTWRNKKDNDGTTTQLYADDAVTVDQKQATSSAAGTVTKGEWATGP